MLANLITLQEISESDFRAMFQSTSFPAELTNVVTMPRGYGVITAADIPEVPQGKVLHEGRLNLVNGLPVRNWELRDAPINPPEVQSYVDLIQLHLDEQAKLRGYDNILSLCSYANSSDLTFAAEAHAGIVCRDACWRIAHDLFAQVNTGEVNIPPHKQVQEMLPTIHWPVAVGEA